MSTRESRIARVVRVRDERLKEAVAVLELARAAERKAEGELAAALTAREAAEAARRERSLVPGDVLEFILAEDWLRSQAILEELARHRAHKARAVLEKAQLKVKEAHVKVRQLEQLKNRLEQARRAKETRTERVLEDEIGQRVAQSQRGRR
jgi:hypothetical protein